MATPPAKVTAPRASSILSQEQTATTPTKPAPSGAPTSITTRAWVTLRRAFFTIAEVTEPGKLFDVLNRMQESTEQILGVVSTNQLIPGNIIRGVVFGAGETKYLAHGLGREWQGYFPTRATAVSGVILLTDVAQPPGVGKDTVLPLLSGNAGTFDIYVF